MNLEDVEEKLTNLGYKLKNFGNYWKTNAAYRNGESKDSLVIYKDTLKWFDYPNGKGGTIEDLFKLNGLDNLDFDIKIEQKKETIKEDLIFEEDIVSILLPIYGFYLDRGISENTLKTFEAGFCHSGKMYSRIVFLIRDFNRKIIGVAGRTTLNNGTMKWKILGRKANFVYPWHIAEEYIKKEGFVIIVEGISDLLALWEVGIRNVLCLFGLNINDKMVNYLISLNVEKIVLALNDEPEKKKNWGLLASKKIQTKLETYFEQPIIYPPNKKNEDFGDMAKEEILNWKGGLWKRIN